VAELVKKFASCYGISASITCGPSWIRLVRVVIILVIVVVMLMLLLLLMVSSSSSSSSSRAVKY
jgi:phage shock protein PspC (stress-responsive transcriptional regulator)